MAFNLESYIVGVDRPMDHDLMVSVIGPRPIGWISSSSAQGSRNLAPYSFFNMLSYDPPLMGFSSIGWKDTVANVTETREFVWNLATRDLAEPMNMSSAELPAGMDEFEFAGLEAAPCIEVSAPRVASSPVSFECRVTEIIGLRDLDAIECAARLVIGQVVAVHVDRGVLANGVLDVSIAKPILRAGGRGEYYGIDVEQRFHMRRPR